MIEGLYKYSKNTYILTFSNLLFEKASKWEENASDVAHSGLETSVGVIAFPWTPEPNCSLSEVRPFI